MQQQGSQYGGVPPDLGSLGSAPRTQMLAAGGGGSEQAEAASPISSRPPASIMNFDDFVDDTDRAGSISSGNRWPRQETVALLKIRSEMDVAFRDATLKGPLWEEVSRKLGELGYVRSGKKCKEKFENVHKYYKRTKDGRAGRQDGKTYRFFTHLEALQAVTASGSGSGSTNLIPSTTTTPPPPPPLMTSTGPPSTPLRNMQFATPVSVGIGGNIVMQRAGVAPPSQPFTIYSRDLSMGVGVSVPGSMSAAAPAPSVAPIGISFSSDSSSSGSYDSDEDEEGVDDVSEEERPSSTPVGSGQKRKRGYSFSSIGGGTKRRMMDFFEGLMKQVMQKQEAMQQRFLEAIEKREQDRMMREEAWKRQEAARLSREQELMVQERATAASRDAAIVSFLQKITGQTVQLPQPVSTTVHQHVAVTPAAAAPSVPTMPPAAPASIPSSTPPSSRQQFQQKQHKSQQQKQQQKQQPQNTDLVRQHQMPPPPSTEAIMAVPERQIPPQDPPSGGGGGSSSEAASSRWPKVEILALIKLRSNLENRYQEAGPKGPLWEEISAGMQRMGYSRSSRRCKEKWENINKYFKKVKESNKKRPEDAKTCPYFNELDALYQKKILGGAYSGSSGIMVPFQQQQPQQGLSVDQSKNQETSISNVGAAQTSAAAQVESTDKRDGTDLEQPNNGGLPDSIFEDQGGNAGATGGSRKMTS